MPAKHAAALAVSEVGADRAGLDVGGGAATVAVAVAEVTPYVNCAREGCVQDGSLQIEDKVGVSDSDGDRNKDRERDRTRKRVEKRYRLMSRGAK